MMTLIFLIWVIMAIRVNNYIRVNYYRNPDDHDLDLFFSGPSGLKVFWEVVKF